MGEIFQDLISITIITVFLLCWYSVFRKQTLQETFDQIKEWYMKFGEEEEDG